MQPWQVHMCGSVLCVCCSQFPGSHQTVLDVAKEMTKVNVEEVS